MMSSNEQLVPVEQLKPCPCCRSTRLVPPPKHWPNGCVYCRDCGLRANSPAAWNTRTPPAVEPDEGLAPVAWLHTLHMEQGQESRRLGFVDESLFGTPGKDHSEEHPVTITPLYATPSIRAQALEEAWQPTETAPETKGQYFWCSLAFGPIDNLSYADGFRWNGKWFAAATFYNAARRFDECQYEFRQIEVQPHYWRPRRALKGGQGV